MGWSGFSTLLAALALAGTRSLSPPRSSSSLRGYRGLFDERGSLINDVEKAMNEDVPIYSQLYNELADPRAYSKTRFGS